MGSCSTDTQACCMCVNLILVCFCAPCWNGGGGLDRLYDMVLADAGPVEKLIVFGFHV